MNRNQIRANSLLWSPYIYNRIIPCISDFLLHTISNRLQELLSNKSLCDSLCEIDAISKDTDIETLLLIYIDQANVKDGVYKFAVVLSKGEDISRLSGPVEMLFTVTW